MNCYDCALEDTVEPAVAVCCHCGSGVCVRHAHVSEELVRRTVGMGLSYGRKPARRMTCSVCREAEAFGAVRRAA